MTERESKNIEVNNVFDMLGLMAITVAAIYKHFTYRRTSEKEKKILTNLGLMPH